MAYSFLTRGGGSVGANLFSLATNDRTGGNGRNHVAGQGLAWTLGKSFSPRG